jgi:nitrite reductase/ring-hydroxylating ferredoxin subunit
MGTIPVANPSPPRRLGFPRRQLAVVTLLAAVAGAFIVAAMFAWPAAQQSPMFTAGLADDFDPGSVTYFEDRHLFLVRMSDGDFVALSDSAQHLGGETVEWRPDFELQGVRGWFRSPMHQETFSMDGAIAFGPARSDMQRLVVTVPGGRVRIDTRRSFCPEDRPATACAAPANPLTE